jgi:hypothetical protein
MPRFIRSDQQPEDEQDKVVSDEEHAEMLARVRAYAGAMTPDPESPLSPREQLVRGVTRPSRVPPPRRRRRY